MPESERSRDDGFATTGPDAREYGRYAAVVIDGDRLMLYDVEEADAWLQSDAAVPLGDVS